MELKATIELWKRGDWFIAQIPELDFIAQSKTVEEAKENLREVARIQFAEMREIGSFEDYLSECGFTLHGDTLVQEKESIGFEKEVLQVA